MRKITLSFLLALVFLSTLMLPTAFAQEEDPYGKYSEPITISILSEDFKTGNTNYDANDPTRKSAMENIWIDAYKDFLNIDVQRVVAEDSTALNALINTGMASNDLPDFVICSKPMLYTMAENGVLQNLAPAYEGYQEKRLLKDAADSLDMWEAGTIDGELLGFPVANNFYNSTQVLWVRQDWLDQVKMQPPTTIDELIQVARAFKEHKPGGADTIPLGMDAANSAYDFKGILAAYGAILETWTEMEDGTYQWGHTNANVKEGLLTLQEMYKEGLIKADFAVSNIVPEEVANGKIGMYYATSWHSVTDLKTNMNNDPNAQWVCVAAPSLDGQPIKQLTNAICEGFVVATQNCKNPEAIFKMMELEQHMYVEPTDEEIPVYYTADDGFLYWDLRIFRNFGRGDFDLYRSKLINEALDNNTPVEEVAPVIKDWYGQCLQALDGNRDLLGRYLCQTMAYPLIQKLYDQDLLVPGYNGPLTETMTVYQTTINDELVNSMVKVIMGEDISVWEKGVTDWYANGGQTITDEVTAYYAAMK